MIDVKKKMTFPILGTYSHRNGNSGNGSRNALKTKDAGVAELADARDLKFSRKQK